MKTFLQKLGLEQEKYMLYYDNKNTIHISKNPAFYSKSKYIDVRYHWIQDASMMELLCLEKIHIY